MASGTAWTTGESLAGAFSGSRAPALAVIGDVPHLVWQATGTLYHSYLEPQGWSAPVPLAMGGEPALAATPDGDLHCLFSNPFAGNHEIYHAKWHAGRWSLPRNVSNTSGASTHPSLVVDPEGALHAVWTDATPGHPVVYYGRRSGQFWTSQAIHNSRGVNPVLAAGPTGTLYAAWQDTSAAGDLYNVYCCPYYQGAWQLPENVSDTLDGQSIQPSLTVDALGLVHLVWQEQQEQVFHVRYSQRVPEGWTVPANLTNGSSDCLLPQICANLPGLTELIWLEDGELWHRVGQAKGQIQWRPAEAAVSTLPGVADLALAVSHRGYVHVSWSAMAGDGTTRVYYAQREPVLKYQYIFPTI